MNELTPQFSLTFVLILLGLFYGGTFVLSLLVNRKEENVDGYMVSSGNVGFGISAASMTATWIWAASFYGAAISGFKYGLSGPLHYGLWGALMILFIYPFGLRFRAIRPQRPHAGRDHARPARLVEPADPGGLPTCFGSAISLMVNFTAAGALVAVLSPLTFVQGVLIAAIGVLAYTLWSGFRASILTDFAPVVRHDAGRDHHHPLGAVQHRRAGGPERGHDAAHGRAGRHVLAHRDPGAGGPLLRRGPGLRHRQPDDRAAACSPCVRT